MSEQQTCPRRLTDFGPWERTPGLDRWAGGGGLVGQAQVGKSCSFCGSLHPDRFMELVREGWIVGPTDKNYKAYLAQPYTAEQLADRKAKWLATDTNAHVIRQLGERDGKPTEQIDADLEAHWAEIMAPLYEAGQDRAKFYYQHLSDDQQQTFVDLVNQKTMKIGYPGHFYVLPYFMRRGPHPAD